MPASELPSRKHDCIKPAKFPSREGGAAKQPGCVGIGGKMLFRSALRADKRLRHILFPLFLSSRLLIFQASQLPSFRAPLCNFVCFTLKLDGGFWWNLGIDSCEFFYYNTDYLDGDKL